MEMAAMRIELLRDAGLKTSIGSAIKDKRRAIYAEALSQMQRQKMERVITMGNPTRLALHKVSFEAMSAAVFLFDGSVKINNQGTDIVTPKLKQAEEGRIKQNKEYKEEQTYLRIVQDHQKTMVQRRKEEQQRQANKMAKGEGEGVPSIIDKQSLEKPWVKMFVAASNAAHPLKGPLVKLPGQSQGPVNKIVEKAGKYPPAKKGQTDPAYPQHTPQEKKTNSHLSFPIRPNRIILQESKIVFSEQTFLLLLNIPFYHQILFYFFQIDSARTFHWQNNTYILKNSLCWREISSYQEKPTECLKCLNKTS